MKRKPRPAKAGEASVGIDASGTIVIVLDKQALDVAELTPAQAKRIGRKLLELAEYMEEKGET